MNLQLENKLALVSGSTAGIGFAICQSPRRQILRRTPLLQISRVNGSCFPKVKGAGRDTCPIQ